MSARPKPLRLALATVLSASIAIFACSCGGGGSEESDDAAPTTTTTTRAKARNSTLPGYRAYVATIRRGYGQLAVVVPRFEGNCYTSTPDFGGCHAAAVAGARDVRNFQGELARTNIPFQLVRADDQMRRGLRRLAAMFTGLQKATDEEDAAAVEDAVANNEVPGFDALNSAGFKVKRLTKSAALPLFQP